MKNRGRTYRSFEELENAISFPEKDATYKVNSPEEYERFYQGVHLFFHGRLISPEDIFTTQVYLSKYGDLGNQYGTGTPKIRLDRIIGDMCLRHVAEYCQEIKHLHPREYELIQKRLEKRKTDRNARRIIKSLWWNQALTEFATIIEVTKKRKNTKLK